MGSAKKLQVARQATNFLFYLLLLLLKKVEKKHGSKTKMTKINNFTKLFVKRLLLALLTTSSFCSAFGVKSGNSEKYSVWLKYVIEFD